jgi:hypothetical protein
MTIRRVHCRELALAVTVVALAAGGITGETGGPSYEVVELERKLYRERPEPEVLLELGSRPEAGDLLKTGSRSSAVILCPEAEARFRLGSKTRARLAARTPGVLLELEKGRLRAIFDRFTGGESPERLVTTPSAVLTVRGTEYGVEVSGKGNTRVVVFSGEVEVVDIGRLGEPVVVGAGMYCDIRRGKPAGPTVRHQMASKDWDRGARVDSRSRTGGPDMGMGSGGSMGSGSQGAGRGGSGGSSRGGGRH